MKHVSASHFGGNIILTRDSISDKSAFCEVMNEANFSHFRYPGGGVTEEQTWENGGLERMFGDPMDPDDENYVMTIREALSFTQSCDISLTIVIPTFQFLDRETGEFKQESFEKYTLELEKALGDFPEAKVASFEIGNEYWGAKNYGAMTATEYGFVANEEIRLLHELSDRLHDKYPDWSPPTIGIQAGAAWRSTGIEETHEIASMISMENREIIEKIYQHSYPNLDRNDTDWQQDWAIDPMREYREIEGFREDLTLSISEFNINGVSVTGVSQAAAWIEEFSDHIQKGIDEFQHWGISYEWLSNKFYDTQFPAAEADNGEIVAKATPLGQVYDLAASNLVGKSIISDEMTLDGLHVSGELDVTGFRDSDQKVAFLHNPGPTDSYIDISEIPEEWHVTVHHLKNADSPYSTWYDESLPAPLAEGEIADARGDMNVVSGTAAPESFSLATNEMAILFLSQPGSDLVIEGAHNVTDDTSGMVNDFLVGGAGNDILRGYVGNDTLEGSAGRNVLRGGKGDDLLKSGPEGDVVFADGGKDTVEGGDGNDVIFVTGEDEGDRAEITLGEGSDSIYIFSDQDVLIDGLSEDDSICLGGSFEDAESFREAVTISDRDLLIDLPNGGSVRLVESAGRFEDISDQVLDFRNIRALPNNFFEGLSYEQVIEIFDGVNEACEEIPDDSGMSWEEIEERIAELEASQRNETIEEEAAETEESSGNSKVQDAANSVDRVELYQHLGVEKEPEPVEEMEDEQDPVDASGGACFVATAAYGDRMHPDVVALRNFRDQHLIRYRLGRSFVRFYWIVGPKLAAFTRPHQAHARITRLLLSAIVRLLRKVGLT